MWRGWRGRYWADGAHVPRSALVRERDALRSANGTSLGATMRGRKVVDVATAEKWLAEVEAELERRPSPTPKTSPALS